MYKESDNVELKRKVTRVYVINYNVGQDLLKHLAKSEYESYIRAVASCPATCKETLNYIFERIVINEYWPDTTIYVVCLDIAGNKSTDGMLLDRIFEPLEKINSLGTVERMLVYREISYNKSVSSKTLDKFVLGSEVARTVISLSEKLIDEQFYLLLKDTSIMIRQNAAEQLKKDILNTISPQTIKLNNNKNKREKISGIY